MGFEDVDDSVDLLLALFKEDDGGDSDSVDDDVVDEAKCEERKGWGEKSGSVNWERRGSEWKMENGSLLLLILDGVGVDVVVVVGACDLGCSCCIFVMFF